MANYDTLLTTWGATGEGYPGGYSYVEGEQPVDDWDNFFAYNTVENIKHLVSLTNKRVETGSGTSFPSSPEASYAFYRSDDERLYTRNSTQGSWEGLLSVEGDEMRGDLSIGGHTLKGVGSLSMDGVIDLESNDLKDTSNGNLLYDASAGHIPLDVLENSDITVNTDSHISGADTVTLGGSITLGVNDDFVENDGDLITGELTGRRSTSERIFTAADTSTGDKFSVRINGSDNFQLVGYDSSAGAWEYANALTYTPGTGDWDFGSLPAVNGNTMATRTWVESSASASDADTVDGYHATDLGLQIEEDGTTAVSNSTGIDFTGHLNVVDDGDGTVTIDPTHNHDGRYYRSTGNDTFVAETRTNDPSSPQGGRMWIRTDL